MEYQKKKIAVVFGTRPDAIKLAPVIKELQKQKEHFSVCLIATAQHRTMLDDVLSVFEIVPNYDLNVMSPKQSLSILIQQLLEKIDYVFALEEPDLVIVQGDTATTFAASLAAFHRKIRVAHVEAGLRTNNKQYPFPEEIYRRLTTQVSDLHFTPTTNATRALVREGVARTNIVCTGNTVIDALQFSVKEKYQFSNKELHAIIEQKNRIVVVTTHRRENWGKPLEGICSALKTLALKHSNVNFVFPVHLNPIVRDTVFKMLNNVPNVHLIDPLNYSEFINLVAQSYFVISDSGGIQEEAPSLGKPVLVLRDVTERPEAAAFGTAKLVGTESEVIYAAANKLLSSASLYKKMATAVNPYGDGKASERIVQSHLNHFQFSKKKVKEFVPRTK